jgi:two-component system NarL family sensor kinase
VARTKAQTRAASGSSISVVPRTTRWLRDPLQQPRLSVSASVARFAATGLLVAALLTVITGLLARREGAQEATRSFDRLAAVVAGSVLAPRLTPELRQRDPAAEAQVRGAAEPLLQAGSVARITVRDADGLVLWSAQAGAIGTRAPLGVEQRRALADGAVVSAEETQAGGDDPAALLTASVGVQDSSGMPLLVDVSERYDDMQQSARRLWLHFAPAGLGALIVLEVVQIPLAWGLARRIRRHQEAGTGLLHAALEASDVERRRIASDVHDTVVPGLTGLAYALDAARLNGSSAGESAALLGRTADGVRHTIAELRALAVDLSRTRLPEAGLGPALNALAAGMEVSGTRVTVEANELEELPRQAAEILYRCAQETLRNVATHSRAETVEIRIVRNAEDVTMIVDDDGRGFDESRFSASEETGHLGLRALGHLVADAGGSLTASSAPGQGTRVVVRVPLDAVEVDMRVTE